MNAFGNIIDRILGRGDHSVTVPPMDGALRPNDDLERAPAVCALPDADNLAKLDDRLVVSSGRSLHALEGDTATLIKTFDSDIACMAGLPDGSCLVGLADGVLAFVGGARDGRIVALPRNLLCLTAISVVDANTVILTNGSDKNRSDQWTNDLLAKGRTGSAWLVTLSDGQARKIADGLAFPYGAMVEGASVILAEAWTSRLLRIPTAGGKAETVLENLPGYPARLVADQAGGSWLSVFAPRSQLLEFVLREDEYRSRMLREVPRDYWIAPSLRSGRSFLEPLQAGGVKQLGVLKPWAPSRSYGLLVRLDREFRPRASYHSRADGSRHGITSSLVTHDSVWFTAKGDGVVGRLEKEAIR
jgi:hypothetical protein